MAEVTLLFDQQSLEESLTEVVDKWGLQYGPAVFAQFSLTSWHFRTANVEN